MTWCLVSPAAKVSGGNREVLRFGEELAARGGDVLVLWMWKAAHPMSSTLHDIHLSAWRPRLNRAMAELPVLLFRFIRRVRGAGVFGLGRGARFVFTHYVTLPLSLAVPSGNRYFLVQDLEWKFVGSPWVAYVLRHTILYCYRRGVLISANPFLTAALRDMRLEVPFELPIWADERFALETSEPRDIDISMVLRKGAHKRLDLYLSFIQLARERNLKLAVISPDEDLIAAARGSSNLWLLRPSLPEMRALYARSKCFLHLSDHEGFGLPPLEAMGAGCVPICRDSGGVRAFMCVEGLQPLLIPLTLRVGEILNLAEETLNDVPQLGVLSRIARDVFDRGIAGTKAARNSCLERLAAKVST